MKLPSITMLELSTEQAYDAAEILEQVQRLETDAIMVYTGIHPTFGSVHIVIPPLGGPVVLPLLIQDLGI